MRYAAFFLIWFLAACAPTVAPGGEKATTPVLADDSLMTRDGTRLPLRRWESEKPAAVIVALHGMSDYSNAFDMPAKFWAQHGVTTLAYDQRGFGAGPNPGIWAGSDVMRRDLCDAVEAAHVRYPGVPVFALGESMGGAVVLTALADPERPHIAGAILVAPAVWSRADMPLLYRGALFFAAHLLPGVILSNSAASHVVTIVPSDNIAMLRALGRDPLFQKQTRNDTLYGLVNLMDEARSAPVAIRNPPPILFLYGKNDQIIPAKPTQAVIAELGSAATVRRYDKGYHMLLRDLEGPLVWRDTLDWIAATRTAPCSFSHSNHREKTMPNPQDDLRNVGKPGAPDSNPAPLASGKTGIPLPDTAEHSVKPIAGDNGGVADGQVTKSN